MYGAFPTLPYGRGGEDLSMVLYPDCKPRFRDGLGHLLKQVWPEMGAAVTCSNPYVEANLLRQANGRYHVALVNYSGKPVQTLEVRIRAAEVGGARGARATFGKAEVAGADGLLLVTLPLNKFDWLSLE